MPPRKPIVPDDVLLEQDAPQIAKTVAEVVGNERQRGWAFANQDGRFVRQDVLDRLLTAKSITDIQFQAGKRYQRQYSAALEYGRCVSTLEFRRSDHATDENGVQKAIWLGQAQRQALGGNHRLMAAMREACEATTAVRDAVALKAALTRLADYYADLEDESDDLEEAPARRTLQDRAAELMALWEGHNRTARARKELWIPGQVLRLLVEAQGSRCAICGGGLDPQGASLDHVVPLYKGGPDEPWNLTAAHPKCNHRKGSSNAQPYQVQVLAGVNEILGWAPVREDPEEVRARRLAEAAERLANPTPVAKPRPRFTRAPKEAPIGEPIAHLEKPSRGEANMHEKWLAAQGVLKSNRSMRSRGVNAGSRRK